MGIIYKMAAGELPSSSSSSVVHPVANYKVLPVCDDYAMPTNNSSSALTSISGILCPPSAIRPAGSSSSNHHEKKGKNNQQEQVLNEQGNSSTDHNYNVSNKPNKTIARMKELLNRWSTAAAAAKQSQSHSQSHDKGAAGKSTTPSYIVRKVAYFRNKGTLKAANRIRNSDNMIIGGGDGNGGHGIISNSPKISFKWDIGSCSTSSSVYSLSVVSLPSSSTCRNNTNHHRSTASTTTPAAYISNDDDHQRRPSSSSTANYRTSYGSCNKDIAVIPEAISSSDPSTTATRFGNWITTDDDFVVLEL